MRRIRVERRRRYVRHSGRECVHYVNGNYVLIVVNNTVVTVLDRRWA